MKNRERILLLLGLMFSFLTACAERDVPITVQDLPEAAQTMLSTHFNGIEVSKAEREDEVVTRGYEVLLANGVQIDFDTNGEWTEVDCYKLEVPSGLVPQPIADYVKQNYAGETVNKIERDRGNYEIELSNRIEITFNSAFKVVKTEK